MAVKSERVERLLGGKHVQGLSPYYTGFFDCFNRWEFFEAHDVLEQLWLKDRPGPNGAFYKGLIQLAGAFVHVRKKRRGPALALLALAHANLSGYPLIYERLNVADCLRRIMTWREQILRNETELPDLAVLDPRLNIESQAT